MKKSVALNVDSSRAFTVPVASSNLTRMTPQVVPLTLRELVNIRNSTSASVKGNHPSHSRQLRHSEIEALRGSGLISDLVKSGRRKVGDLVEYAGNQGVDYLADKGRGGVGAAAKRVRGDGFLRNILSGGVRGLGNITADAIKGNGLNRPRRPAKMMYEPEMQQGDGFFRDIASGGVRFLGNAAADVIKGGKVRRRRKAPMPAPQMRGDGFFRDLASGGVRFLGNAAADVIKGGKVRRRRKVKMMDPTMMMEMPTPIKRRRRRRVAGNGLTAPGMRY